MNFDNVIAATNDFVRTRDGLAAYPTIRGFMRHVEANIHLYEAIVGDPPGTRLSQFSFAIYRALLIFACNVRHSAERARRWL